MGTTTFFLRFNDLKKPLDKMTKKEQPLLITNRSLQVSEQMELSTESYTSGCIV